jgi:hypothetical protein
VLIIAKIGTAVVIFPIVRRQNEELALGYVTARIVESRFILVGIVSIVAIITLRNQAAGRLRERPRIRSPRSRTGHSSSVRAGWSAGGTA